MFINIDGVHVKLPLQDNPAEALNPDTQFSPGEVISIRESSLFISGVVDTQNPHSVTITIGEDTYTYPKNGSLLFKRVGPPANLCEIVDANTDFTVGEIIIFKLSERENVFFKGIVTFAGSIDDGTPPQLEGLTYFNEDRTMQQMLLRNQNILFQRLGMAPEILAAEAAEEAAERLAQDTQDAVEVAAERLRDLSARPSTTRKFRPQ